MSLISEALKKAHMEALRQERTSGHLNRMPGAIDMPQPGRNRRTVFVAVVLSNLVLLTAIIIGAWFLLRGQAQATSGIAGAETSAAIAVRELTPEPSAPPEVQAQAVVVPPLQPAPEVVRKTAEPKPAPPPKRKAAVKPPPPAEPAPDPAERPLPRLGAAPVERVSVTVGPIEAEPPADAPARPSRGLRGLENGRTYPRTAKTSDGFELTLYGLSIAGERGVALLNGRVLKEGDRIGDFTVGAVERGRVEIRNGSQRFYLTMR